jgi:SAM-dependent methyltransferase
MLLSAFHKWASNGRVYDLIQTLLGVKFVYRRFARVLGPSAYHTVFDMGGGTGRAQALLSSGCLYFCLDNEMPKLLQYRRRATNPLAILGDATMAPVVSGSMDLVLCISVAHHLTDSQLERMVVEASRILRPGGRLLFFDPLWSPHWLPGRLFWSLDRGSNPRSKMALLNVVTKHTRIVHQEQFRLWHCHEYLLLIGSKAHSPERPHTAESPQM